MTSVPPIPPISQDDIEFGPVEGFFINGTALFVHLADGRITIRDESAQWEGDARENIPLPAEEEKAERMQEPNTLIWTGPLAEARFLYEGTPTLHTLKDERGAILWSKATEKAFPDLLLETRESGEARLTGKGGTLLWEGTLPRGGSLWNIGPKNTVTRRTHPTNPTCELEGAGVHVSGSNGAFTVTDQEGALLWSGTLPKKAVILLRRGGSCVFLGCYGSSSGTETNFYKDMEIQFEIVPCEVAVTDFQKNVLFTFPRDLLRCAPKHLRTESPELQARAEASGIRIVSDSPNLFDTRFIPPAAVYTRGPKRAFLFIFKDSHGREIFSRPYPVKVKI